MSATISTNKINSCNTNEAGEFVATSTDALDVAALEQDALAALLDEFAENFDNRPQGKAHQLASDGDVQDDSPIWQGEESYISDVEVTSQVFGASITFDGLSSYQIGTDDQFFI